MGGGPAPTPIIICLTDYVVHPHESPRLAVHLSTVLGWLLQAGMPMLVSVSETRTESHVCLGSERPGGSACRCMSTRFFFKHTGSVLATRAAHTKGTTTGWMQPTAAVPLIRRDSLPIGL